MRGAKETFPTAILGRDRELWLGPTLQVHDSRTFCQIRLVENMKRILCAYSENQVRPELSIPATGQKDCGLWGREWLKRLMELLCWLEIESIQVTARALFLYLFEQCYYTSN